MKKREKKKQKKKNPLMFVSLIMGVVIGVGISFIMSRIPDEEKMSFYFASVFAIVAASLIQIIIHELGHLLFGLLSGYRFSSFRIFSFVIKKEQGKTVLRRMKLAGTGGQCLMIPPEMKDGLFPVFLYNLGGSILNLLSGIPFVILFFRRNPTEIFSVFCLCMACMGLCNALLNGIPMQSRLVVNDGYNAWNLRKSPEALRAFWIQLNVSHLLSEGVRIRDMEDEWFVCPENEAMQCNSMITSLGVLHANRLMDEHRFTQADAAIMNLLENGSKLNGISRNSLLCDRLYCEIIGENRREVVESFFTKELKSYMKAMKNSVTVIRVKYAYSALVENNQKKTQKLRKQFDCLVKTYSYPGDALSERHLMDLVDRLQSKKIGNCSNPTEGEKQ